MYPLSFLDQLTPAVFMPLIYFYAKDSEISNAERSVALKSSLSQVLTTFYPLSGRVKDDLHVFCNDQGVPFLEARANCKLSEVIKSPVPKELNKFHAYELSDTRDIAMAVQVTFFRCDGMAVGLLINHRIADALSFFMFANAWTATARNEYGDMKLPIFESAAIFPARHDVAMYRRGGTGMMQEELVSKIFTFPASKISILRDRYTYSSGDVLAKRRPTRVEAVSAFLWSRFVAAKDLKPDPNKIFTVLHAVNLRTRMNPPLSEYYFGNICCFTIATPNMEVSESDQASRLLVQQVRESIGRVNGDYIAKLREGEHLKFLKKRAALAYQNELVTLNFTSLCRFPLYEADFGWGKPVFVGSACLTYKNIVTFLDTPSGDGIEAWICMTKEDMEMLEQDLELKDLLAVKTG
ncbi:HXXXD-type acyl-transferase family protein [Dorcoceras hygrometricum]|uniref:HXXXD-type acyl-transferase family protein n=1 Tax=Dorcoceras hygrometricum TaxID=472368 RepID=A0A2Z7DCN6_9LAMI|nr:HXXXD-type acyl-transferase family protein [Dorcoceras hygrometricum]